MASKTKPADSLPTKPKASHEPINSLHGQQSTEAVEQWLGTANTLAFEHFIAEQGALTNKAKPTSVVLNVEQRLQVHLDTPILGPGDRLHIEFSTYPS